MELRGLKLYTSGPMTIVTFDRQGSLAGQTFIGDAAARLDDIVETHQTKVLVIDLTGIKVLPSDMIGVLISLHNRGIEVRLFNTTEDVRFTMGTMNLEDLFDFRDGDLHELIEGAEEH